ALGHLHKFHAPQLNAAYAGSLERLDFGDVNGDKGFVEVDLDAGAGSNEFLRLHPIPTRPMMDITVPCEGLSPAEVLEQLTAATKGTALDGAVVRVRFESIQRDVYHALDLVAVEELFEPCLHVVRSIGRTGLVTGGDGPDDDISFAVFAR